MVEAVSALLGSMGFLFRFWITEIKLKDELGYRRRMVSRFMTYYFFLAWMLNWESTILNIVVFVPIFIEIGSFASYDMKYFIEVLNPKKRDQRPNTWKWMVIERITLHFPLMLVEFIWISQGLPSNLSAITWWEYISAYILIYGAWILFDERLSGKLSPKAKIIMINLAVLQFSGWIFYFF